jgi:adenylylsulfate kinase
MIYWLTGQPGSGKTTLGLKLKEKLGIKFHIDGDDLRDLLTNKDYSKAGREANIKMAQNIALYLTNQNEDVIVTLVSPYENLRQELKDRAKVVEIYVHTSDIRGRESFHVLDYQPPISDFIEIDTTNTSIANSLLELETKLNQYVSKN